MDFLRSISSDKIPCPDPTVRVELGFLDLYTDRDDTCRYCKFSAREQVLTEVNMLVNEAYPDEEVSVTIVGHSLGGAGALAIEHLYRRDGELTCGRFRAVPCAFSHLRSQGYHGRGQRFVLANGRDYALVNKGCDFLKDEFEIPPNWRQDYNKGMVRNKEGRWVQQERVILDDHPTHMLHHLNKIGLSTNNNYSEQ
ncbi:hypothetical protein DH2020_001429 [Rehmannia glutinosa]|uniref:Phospholipase A1 n=1 Tax=Rehmannia glutinosa TaxID=99300 RepID=A0ABR0XZR3_REHGL